MLLSISFSGILYRISSNELIRGVHRQDPLFIALQKNGFLDFQDTREKQVSEGQERLRNNLILFNLATLFFGGLASYLLARRTLQPIEEALDSQARFASDASHELRTPLAVMETEIEVALRNKELRGEEMKQLLKSNLEEVVKLKLLSEQLLRLARKDSEALLMELLPLNDIATTASERLTPLANKKSIVIRNELPRTSLIVKGDKAGLTEICTILLDNAIKYSEAKSNITLSIRKSDNHAIINVADQGRGISPENLPHIFDRFYQVETSRTKEHAGGYGLGLSIAETLVKAHKGTIAATSQLGKGTTFIVRLPLEKAAS